MNARRATSSIELRRLGLIVAFLLQTALLKAALPPNPDEPPARPSLAGQLLVAAPSMGDPYFERTVILIVQHSPSGSLGILDILRDIGAKKGPAKILVAFGYTGWGPDQLEREIKVHAWGIAEADPALVFDEDRDKVWDYAWKHRIQDL